MSGSHRDVGAAFFSLNLHSEKIKRVTENEHS